MFTEPCVTEKYFINRKFIKESEGVYSRLETKVLRHLITGEPTGHILERTVRFKIYHVDPELGTNIEYYIGPFMQFSGYWHDVKDFQSNINI